MYPSSVVYQRLKETLLRCAPFDDAAALRAIFAHPSLVPWRYHVSDADDAQTRVEKLLARLAGQADAAGTPALVLLLNVLAEREPGTKCAEDLRALAGAVAAAPPAASREIEQPAGPLPAPARRRTWLPAVVVFLLLIGVGGAIFLFGDLFPTGGPGPEEPEPPHAPAIEDAFGPELDGAILFDENVEIARLAPGEQQTASMEEWWSAPIDAPVSGCADGFIALTWIVRDPYPGGDGLEIHQIIPMGGGRTELIGAGAEGKASVSKCQELTFFNTGLQPYLVEIRHISAMQ